MSRILKQVLGIDVSQNELVVCFGRLYNDLSQELAAYKTFANSSKGFEAMVHWATKLSDADRPVHYVMEATGVYHQSLAYYLHDAGATLSVVLPNKISNYARTLSTKTITDKTASEAITRFGLERKLDGWQKPNKVYKRLQQLTRERGQLIAERTVLKNQLHAENAEADPYNPTIRRIKKRISLLDKQEAEIGEEIEALVKTDEATTRQVQLLCSIPGVGLITAATVLAETNGFDLIRNKRQLTSYAGLDVREKQSGTSVKGKPRISKRGNKNLRKAMYLPALAAIRHNPRYKAIYARLVAKHGIKMKAAVAIQRKMLELMYTIYKTQKPYDKYYLEPTTEEVYTAEILGGEHQ